MPSLNLRPEIKEKWLAALRSGEYTQYRGSLCNRSVLDTPTDEPTAFCCIGVLCDLTRKEHNKVNDTDLNFMKFVTMMKTWDVVCTTRPDLGTASTLVEMNDEEGKSFAEIADYVEAHL